MLDRRRTSYATAHAWFRLCVRFVLAAQMFEYGMTKVIPTQFPAPSLETLVTPVGDLTLSALLWTTIGSSPAYEIFTGCVEVLGGLLLLLPRTTLLGALISLGAAIQIFALNMTFDIGLKLISFHLIVLALVLLAPHWRRLLDVFVLNRTVTPASEVPLAQTTQRAAPRDHRATDRRRRSRRDVRVHQRQVLAGRWRWQSAVGAARYLEHRADDD